MPDIFDQVAAERQGGNKMPPSMAPSAPSGSGDIFDQVAAERGTQQAAQSSSVPQRPAFSTSNIWPNVKAGGGRLLSDIYQVSAPGIGMSLLRKLKPDWADQTPLPEGAPVEQLPEKILTTAAPMMAGEPPEETFGDRPALADQVRAQSGAPGRLARVMKQTVKELPGYGKLSRLVEAWKGPEPEVLPPSPAPPSVPPEWGRGGYGTPVDQWGQRIPPTIEAKPQPLPAAIKPKDVQSQLETSLGASPPLKSNVPLRLQMQNAPQPSSVVRSFQYDPDARELTVETNAGQTYVHGEVTPEEAQGFANAPSKGKAWNQIRSNHVQVAKIVNGKRVSTIPVKSANPPEEDLTREWRNNLDYLKGQR